MNNFKYVEIIEKSTTEPSKLSLIFLLCSDSQNGLDNVIALRTASCCDKQDIFHKFLLCQSAILKSSFLSTLLEALNATRNFKACRLIGSNEIVENIESSVKISKIKLNLYSIAESLTVKQKLNLIKTVCGEVNINDRDKCLEELFLEWDVSGLISFDSDSLPLKLSTAINLVLPEESPRESKVADSVHSDGDYYSIIDAANVGYCIIINQEDFVRNNVMAHLSESSLPPRRGSEQDVRSLHDVFSWLGFSVKIHTNVTLNKLRTLLAEYSNIVQLSHSCLVLVVMSHGTEDVIYTSDSIPVTVEALEMAFQRNHCPQLVGKPKILIIQACQGMSSQRVETDDNQNKKCPESPSVAPERGDALIAWSTVKGYASFRDRYQGSWFIQELCTELKASAATRDLVDIITRVNSNLRKKTNHGYFMVPSMSSSLCKKILFPLKALNIPMETNCESITDG